MRARDYFKILAVVLLSLNLVEADVINGGFEIPDPNVNVLTPYGWDGIEYARAHAYFTPEPERGHYDNWLLNPPLLIPFEGGQFLVLSTGDVTDDELDSSMGVASQQITLNAGETVSFRYFFGSCDFFGWNDFAKIKFIPEQGSGLETIKLVFCHIRSTTEQASWDENDNYLQYRDVVEVGDFGSMEDWQGCSFTFDESNAGTYTLQFGVYDVIDSKYKSYLCVDDVRVECLPPGGDVYADKTIDTKDLAVFSNYLGRTCWDPNLPDPNSVDPNNCIYFNIYGEEESIDYNGDGIITFEDAIPIIENWLWQNE